MLWHCLIFLGGHEGKGACDFAPRPPDRLANFHMAHLMPLLSTLVSNLACGCTSQDIYSKFQAPHPQHGVGSEGGGLRHWAGGVKNTPWLSQDDCEQGVHPH